MCGIIGYIGNKQAERILVEGLKRLEYRGYDSAGIAIFNKGEVNIRRTEGKISRLEDVLRKGDVVEGTMGIGHTRWATHGRPSEDNAHPHRAGDIVLVHNGIIENHSELRTYLQNEGHKFTSETDTEVACHLIQLFYRQKKSMPEAIREALNRIRGSYAFVVINAKEPDGIFLARKGSPLVVGFGEGENFVASDIPALLEHTNKVSFFEDGDLGVMTADGLTVYDSQSKEVTREVVTVPWNPLMAERGGFKHFMLKEIFEQSRVVEDTLAGRVTHSSQSVELEEMAGLFSGEGIEPFKEVAIVACGTSLHAGIIGKYLIETLARIPTTVDFGSEFRYRHPIINEHTLIIPISQSGETADTLAGMQQASKEQAKICSICNSVGSSIARGSDATLYTHAGPEIGVASTKAFTAQLIVLTMIALELGRRTGKVDEKKMSEAVSAILQIPRHLNTILDRAEEIKEISERYAYAENALYIGRGTQYPIALEGALKLKEISYVHAEGFPAGELKHGPIALIDTGTPVVAVALNDATYEKVLANIEEVQARGAKVIALATEGNEEIRSIVDDVIYIPEMPWYLAPIATAIPMQLIAYYIADHKGTDVDQPRNLAKSVTVE